MVADKGLNLFDKCATEDRTPTKINKNGAVGKVRILVELGML